MCTETGIKDVYRGVQGACPRRAVTHARGTAKHSERRAVGMGLKLVLLLARIFGKLYGAYLINPIPGKLQIPTVTKEPCGMRSQPQQRRRQSVVP